MPITPISVSASFTSSSLKGLMIASIFFMASHLVEDGQHQGRDVAADALEVRENVEVDLGRLDRLREAGAQAADVGLAQLALAHAHEGPLVEHLLPEGGQEELDLALEEVDLIVALLDLLEQRANGWRAPTSAPACRCCWRASVPRESRRSAPSTRSTRGTSGSTSGCARSAPASS